MVRPWSSRLTRGRQISRTAGFSVVALIIIIVSVAALSQKRTHAPHRFTRAAKVPGSPIVPILARLLLAVSAFIVAKENFRPKVLSNEPQRPVRVGSGLAYVKSFEFRWGRGFRRRLASLIKNPWPAALSLPVAAVVSRHCGPPLWTAQALHRPLHGLRYRGQSIAKAPRISPGSRSGNAVGLQANDRSTLPCRFNSQR